MKVKKNGFNVSLYKEIKKKSDIPIVAHGGAGNINHIIEIGPKKVLSKLVQKITSNIKVESIDNLEDLINYGLKIIK